MDTKIRVYILQKDRHISCTIIYLGDDFKVTSNEDRNLLDNLSKETDLFLIFSKELAKKISPKKFSTLYDAMGYAVSETNNESIAILNAFEYLDEVLKKHLYYLVVNDILVPFPIENLPRIFGLQIQTAVFSSYRTDYEELKEIYSKEKEYTWWEKLLNKEEDFEKDGLFCYNSSDDDYFLIPVNVFRKVLEEYGNNSYYMDSFENYGFSTFIASSIQPENLTNTSLDEI